MYAYHVFAFNREEKLIPICTCIYKDLNVLFLFLYLPQTIENAKQLSILIHLENLIWKS